MSSPPFSIKALNRASVPEAADMMDRIVERSDWLAARAVIARPFADAAALALDAGRRYINSYEMTGGGGV